MLDAGWDSSVLSDVDPSGTRVITTPHRGGPLKDLTRLAGVGVGRVYRHFPTHQVLLALHADEVAKDPDATAGMREAAEALRAGIDAAAAELRSFVHAVMPAGLIERRLAAAVEDLVDRMPVRTRLDTDRLSTAESRPPAAVESTAYCVVAEGLANALKHARARQLTVRLARTDSQLVVEAVVATAADAAEMVRHVAERRPDLVVTDIRMPPSRTDEGLRAALEIRREWPDTAVVVLSQYVQRRYAVELLSANSSGVGYLTSLGRANKQSCRGGRARHFPSVAAPTPYPNS